jgi:hypothetical protein
VFFLNRQKGKNGKESEAVGFCAGHRRPAPPRGRVAGEHDNVEYRGLVEVLDVDALTWSTAAGFWMEETSNWPGI